MQNFEYKVVAAPRQAKRAKGAKTPADRFARTLAEAINAEAAEGWEYMRADTLPMDEKKSMLGSATEVFQTVLVFRRSTGRVGESASPQRHEAAEPGLRLGPADRGL